MSDSGQMNECCGHSSGHARGCEISSLTAENQRYRDALERIADQLSDVLRFCDVASDLRDDRVRTSAALGGE
jgi:hypothetical protein